MPGNSKSTDNGTDPYEDLEDSFAGWILDNVVHNVVHNVNSWILDSGASDHMTASFNLLTKPQRALNKPQINLPNGHTTSITHTSSVYLHNDLTLSNVLFIPSFKHNPLSVSKATQDSDCVVTFYDNFCLIQNLHTLKIKGVGKASCGLYHLINLPLSKIDPRLSNAPVIIKDADTARIFSISKHNSCIEPC